MDMKTNDFEEYLEQVCFEANPTVLDDDMPDFFDEWLGNQNAEDFIRLGNAFCEERVRAERDRISDKLARLQGWLGTVAGSQTDITISEKPSKDVIEAKALHTAIVMKAKEKVAEIQALTPTKTDKTTEV